MLGQELRVSATNCSFLPTKALQVTQRNVGWEMVQVGRVISGLSLAESCSTLL